MKFKRIISSLLAVLMLMSAFTVVMSAEEAEGSVQYEYNTSNAAPTVDYMTGQSVKAKKNEDGKITGYEPTGEKVIYTAEDKLESMDLRFEKDGYQLYVDEYSGEVATRCIATGEVLFSNPYNVGDSTAQPSIKEELMSQLVVKYVDIASGDDNTYHSYTWAASRGQIVVRNIKNGLRVEYTIGREEARMLVPRQVEKSSFEKKIKNVMEAAVQGDSHASFLFKKLMAYYTIQDPSTTASATLKAEMEKAFPITKKMAIYVLDSSTSQTEMANLEQMIKTYCPDYTYEELDEDHMLTEYEAEDKNPPLFKMALEYSLDENGMTVRLPANGIRFNESLYQLYSVEILPYMGSGANSNDEKSVFVNNSGYTFFPDGSGALFDFEKITDLGASTTVTGKVYGQDYAYHTISGTHQEILRYPVFGIVQKEDVSLLQKVETETEGGEVATASETDTTVVEPDYRTHGFVAIVEEGDALMELSSYHAVRTSEYNTVKMTVYPRPQDTYNVADAISVGQNDTWTVVSSRKYTGNYKIRYIMLTDDEVAEEKAIADYYDCTYAGMAKAYREYLESVEILTRLDDESVKEDIPLYIETFGALQTTERFLSIPVEVMTPLTTFDDIKTMYDDLSNEGVSNINFIMTGYAKGGITQRQVPYNLKWNNAVEEDMDFEDLLAYAREEGFGVYPDFDFVYVQGNGMFDGLSLKKHAVKTIDNRYTSKREYSATKQTYMSYFDLAISPAYFSHFYEKLTDNYLEYDPMGISVSTLGSGLNSDFDEDEPYNREDSKNFTVKAFEYLAENYDKVLTSGGNAYSWKYVDYITDVALDSSRYSQASASVPFLGMVLHGYVEIAGTPVNMEGNIDYAVLKAIENGASLKFILSYRNTNNLKNYVDLSKYYSVRYDIWFDDVVSLYSEINEALKGVQTSVITEHKFVEGVRVPDDDELINDAKAAINAAIAGNYDYADKMTQSEIDAYRNAKQQIEALVPQLNAAVADGGSYKSAAKAFQDAYDAIFADGANDIRTLISTKVGEIEALDKTSQTYATDYALKQGELFDLCISYTVALDTVYKKAQALLDMTLELTGQLAKLKGEYLTLISDEKCPYTDAQKAALKATVDALDINLVVANNIAQAKVAEINGKVATAHAEIVTFIGQISGTDKPLAEGQVVIPEIYIYEITEPEAVKPITPPEKAETPVYDSDENKIVYEVYENGTAFLLNFNNYKVKVEIEINGVVRSYTLDAYGYIILSGAN